MSTDAKDVPRDHKYWDARFSEPGFAYGTGANDFLRSVCAGLIPGDALSLGEGEGRNAVYLAKLGFSVTAVDFSEVGLEKARELAAQHGVTITTLLADLADFDPGAERWDLVISIFAQPPSAIRKRLYGRIAQCLRAHGAFVLETKTQASAADRYPGVDILRTELQWVRFEIARGAERELNEGRYHRGVQRTAQILAFKGRNRAEQETGFVQAAATVQPRLASS